MCGSQAINVCALVDPGRIVRHGHRQHENVAGLRLRVWTARVPAAIVVDSLVANMRRRARTHATGYRAPEVTR
jgi:hypothetical protein